MIDTSMSYGSLQAGGLQPFPLAPTRALPCVADDLQRNRFEALPATHEVVWLPATGRASLEAQLNRLDPDVLLIDFRALRPSDRLRPQSWLDSSWNVATILLLPDATGSSQRRAAQMGIASTLPIDATNAQLHAAVVAVGTGLAVRAQDLPHDSSESLHDSDFYDDESTALSSEHLTPREAEVLRLMANGRTNKQIANRLNISGHTAKFHVSSILSKLGVHTRAGAVKIGIHLGLVAI